MDFLNEIKEIEEVKNSTDLKKRYLSIRKDIKRLHINKFKELNIDIIIDSITNFDIFLCYISLYSHNLFLTYIKYVENTEYINFFVDIINNIESSKSDMVPSFEDTGIITFLYLLSEKCIINNNFKVLKYVSQIYKFEHTHVRLAIMYDNEETIKLTIKNYDKIYEMIELKNNV